jgi:hypothetical protein
MKRHKQAHGFIVGRAAFQIREAGTRHTCLRATRAGRAAAPPCELTGPAKLPHRNLRAIAELDKGLKGLVARRGIEPPTRGFSVADTLNTGASKPKTKRSLGRSTSADSRGGQLVSTGGGIRGYLESPSGGPDRGLRVIFTLLYPK